MGREKRKKSPTSERVARKGFSKEGTLTDLVNEKEPAGGRAGRRAHLGEGSAHAKALRYEWREGQSDER